MTEDNKKTPKEDKITDLSAWQKRNKEYLEKKALEKVEEAETEELESEEVAELLEQDVDSATEDDLEESDVEIESEPETGPVSEASESEGSDAEMPDSAVEDLDIPEEQGKKPSFFNRLKRNKPKKEPTVAKRHLYRALPVIGISSIVALV